MLAAHDPAAVEQAARQVLDNARRHCPQAAVEGVLVQEMVEDGIEVILGMTYDETFGPLVVYGSGGVMAEVLKDAVVGLPPLESEEIRDMLGRLRLSDVLDGFRGRAPRDVDALVDCCVRFAQFVVATEGVVAAIDLNPVFVCARGRGVRIADALIEMRADRQGCHG